MIGRFVLAFALVGCSGAAVAYCPPPPSHLTLGHLKPQKPIKPTPPMCVNTILKTHTCEDWQIQMHNKAIQNYNFEMDQYNNSVKRLIDALKDLVLKTEQYAICEIKSLD
jgi:hypothetical protein